MSALLTYGLSVPLFWMNASNAEDMQTFTLYLAVNVLLKCLTQVLEYYMCIFKWGKSKCSFGLRVT